MCFKGAFINIDPDIVTYFMNSLDGNFCNINEKATEFVKMYCDKGITDLLLCIYEQSSVAESKEISTRSDKYDVKEENGIKVDYTDNPHISHLKWLKDNNIDIFDIWIKYVRNKGINPWITLRMNDVHLWDAETSYLRSDFFYTAKRNGWLLPFGNCYNFAVPEVYTRMLRYIDEQVLKYDVYGIELEFSREIVCFDYKNNPDCYLVMNSFIANVKESVKKAEKKFGHKIKLMVRLTRDINESKAYGFDVLTWAKEGLIDAVVPSPHWATSDSDIPVKQWQEQLSPYGVEVYASVELNLNHWMGLINNYETIKGLCLQYAGLGCEKSYLYNFFIKENLNIYNSIFDYGVPSGSDTCFNSQKYLDEIWRISADINLMRKGVRRHVMTEQDDNSDRGYKGWEPLPKKIDGTVNFNVLTGEIYKTEKATLYVGIDGDEPQVCVNGISYSHILDLKDAYIYTSKTFKCEKVLAVEFEPDDTLKRQSVDVAGKNCTVKYIEIKVIGN